MGLSFGVFLPGNNGNVWYVYIFLPYAINMGEFIKGFFLCNDVKLDNIKKSSYGLFSKTFTKRLKILHFLSYGSAQCIRIEDNRTFKIDIDITLPQATKVIMTPHFGTAEMT